jgi:uncharacterized protein
LCKHSCNSCEENNTALALNIVIKISTMKNLTLFLCFFTALNTIFSQFNPAKPDLCQGAFYTEAQAVTVHQDFAKLYNDKRAWLKRAALIKKGILDGAGISKINYEKPKQITIHSKKIFNGYAVENVSFESTIKGIYVTGNLYTPLSISDKKSGKIPAILCPHGHGADPRYKEYTQQRCATLARMGAVVFAYDMLGTGDSKYCDHKIEEVLKLHLLNGIQIVNFLTSLPYVDKSKIAMTGESGGGTQTFMLAAIDDRIKVSAPVVMVSGYFFGGCVCESGLPIHKRPTHQTTNVEIAACFAPKPLILVSDGGDWTKNNPVIEYPHIKRIYGFFKAENQVENAHFPTEKHDYGISKRLAVYPFLAKHLGLDLNKVMKDGKIDETNNTILTENDLKVFTEKYPKPANALQGNTAVSLAINPTMDGLKKLIKAKFASVKGEFAIAYKDLKTGQTLFINEKENFHAASTMKTPVMIEVFKQAKMGKFQLKDSILVHNTFKSIVDGSPFSLDIGDDSADSLYQKIGQKMTIYDLTYQMIIRSSNLATNIMIDLVGAQNANASMRDLGAKDIQILRGVEDTKAFQKGLNNSITAYDLMLIFENIAQYKTIDKQASEGMIKILLDQVFNEVIPAKLPKTVKVAHKTGSITGVQHDSGIVYLPDGRQYVLVVLSKKLEDTKAGVAALAEVSEMVYQFLSLKM